MSNLTRAMVFVLSDRLFPDAALCIEYCRAQRYNMCGVIRDDWRKACHYLYSGEADVLVVADQRSLDPDRAPRVEVVAHQHTQPERPDVPTGHRRGGRHRRNERTRLLKRDAAV